MRILAIILFSLSVVTLIIGMHQTMTQGFANSYWLFMSSTTFFFGYALIKNYVLKQDDFFVDSKHVSIRSQKSQKQQKRTRGKKKAN